MKIIFLHGLESKPGGDKPKYLQSAGHEVYEPELPNNDFQESLFVAQATIDDHIPDVIVGSSRGGAVAMGIDPRGARLVLIAPAWNKYGNSAKIARNSTILHSENDDTVPYDDSVLLSTLNKVKLIKAGEDHRMNDNDALVAMLAAVEGHGKTKDR